MHKRPSNIDRVTSIIARMPEFHYFTREEAAQLAQFNLHNFKKNETLFWAGEMESKVLIVLLAGNCVIKKPIEVGGKKINVAIEHIHSPAVLGEVGVFSSSSRTANVITTSRSAGIVIPGKMLRRHFEQSKVTFDHLLWSFARLGILRIGYGVQRYNGLMDELVKCDILEKPEYVRELVELKAIIGDIYEGQVMTSRDFNNIKDLVEQVDKSLAYATYLKSLADGETPENDSTTAALSGSLSFLASETLLNDDIQRKSLKKGVVETCSKRYQRCQGAGDWVTCIEGLAEASSDLKLLGKTVREHGTDRIAHPGTFGMLEGFAHRITEQLNDIEKQTLLRFGMDHLPKKLYDDRNSETLYKYLLKKVADVKARVLTDDFETGVFSEYYQAGNVTRDNVARDLFDRLKGHRILALISQRFLDLFDESPPDLEDHTLLDFLVRGHELLYPKLLEPESKNTLNM